MNSVHLVGVIHGLTSRVSGRLFFQVAIARPGARGGIDFVDCVAQGKVLQALPDPLPSGRGVWVGGRLRKESGNLVVAVHDFGLQKAN
jgi:hypothetical protein